MVLSSRRLLLGLGLAATLAATAWVGQDEAAGEAGVAAAAPAASLRLPSRREAPAETASLQLERLPRQHAGDPTQNAFANRSWVKPLVPVQQAAGAPAGPPPLPFTYMGKLQEGEEGPITVYLQQGEQAHSVRQGDVIDQTWRVDSIAAAQIVITYLPMRAKQALSFGTAE